MFDVSAVHYVLGLRRGQCKHATMILVCSMWLEFLPLKPHPFLGRVPVPPLNIMEHVCRKAEHACRTGSTVVICL